MSYKELLHIHQRTIYAEALRDAAGRVANAILAVRNPAISSDVGSVAESLRLGG